MRLLTKLADPVAQADADAVRLRAQGEHERAMAELERENRADAIAAARIAREAKLTDRQDRRAARRRRWSERAAALSVTGQRLRPVIPLLIVTGFAVFGQILYGLDAYAPPAWPLTFRILVASGVAIGVESIALYVSWHAHDALLMGSTATAARLRRASYAIALGVAAVNYSHFAAGWKPTPAAVVFALFSASSPWLWGLHTRRAQQVQLRREGHIDSAGATFSAERRRAFPIRTLAARRWSIDHGVSDPRAAWEGYNHDRVQRDRLSMGVVISRALRGLQLPAKSLPGSAWAWVTAPAGATLLPIVARPGGPGGPESDRGPGATDWDVLEDLRKLAGPLPGRKHLVDTYRMGSSRADRLLREAAQERAELARQEANR